MALFADLRRAKELGYSLTTLMVKAYLDEHGPTPVGLIAKACQTSVRSVERALALLKETGFFRAQTKMTHEHDHSVQELKGSTTETAAVSANADDPIAQQLLALEVLPWCVDVLLAKVDRAVLADQLAYHRHRLASGFKFKAHPAKYLFAACLNNYAPPVGYFEQRQAPSSEPVAAPRPQPVVAEQAPAAMTRDGALTVIRLGLRSKLAHLREQALRLAREWDVDVRALA